MYGQLSRKKYYREEVKLVRLCPYDSRIKWNYNRNWKKIWASVCLLLSVSAVGLVILYVVRFITDTQKRSLVIQGETIETNGEFLIKEKTVPMLTGTMLMGAFTEITENGGASWNMEALSGGAGLQLSVSHNDMTPHTPLIVIDPGHGGEDEGSSRGDVLEKEVNLELAKKLSDKLIELGYEVKLTRETDNAQFTLEERVNIAESVNADLYISIHQNACEEKESKVTGIETWYCADASGNSKRLAQLVHMGALNKTGAQDRELRESRELYVIRETSMPSCLIETSFLSNKKEREAICDPEYQEKLVSGIAQGIDYYYHPKTMYLTFDDGPSEENTVAILDILKEKNIKATFFVVGENVEKHPDVARRIVEEGHTIGIHCNHHNYEEIYASVDSYLADFEEAYKIVYEVTGVEVKLFRFPGGSINAYNKKVYKDIIEKMTEKGYIYFDWNGSLEDAVTKSTPEQLIKNARESTLKRKKVVMLAHDIVYNTRLCLEELIDQFPEYKMEPLTPDVSPIQF